MYPSPKPNVSPRVLSCTLTCLVILALLVASKHFWPYFFRASARVLALDAISRGLVYLATWPNHDWQNAPTLIASHSSALHSFCSFASSIEQQFILGAIGPAHLVLNLAHTSSLRLTPWGSSFRPTRIAGAKTLSLCRDHVLNTSFSVFNRLFSSFQHSIWPTWSYTTITRCWHCQLDSGFFVCFAGCLLHTGEHHWNRYVLSWLRLLIWLRLMP